MLESKTKIRRRRPKSAGSETDEATVSKNGLYLSKAIIRALNVLESFRQTGRSLSLMDIRASTRLPEATLFRILVTLESQEYLVQLKDGSYRLAPKVLWGVIHDRASAIRDLLHPRLQSLAREFDETASSGFLYGDRIQCIDTVDSLRDVRATTRIGRVLPPYASAMGKTITAFQSREIIDQLIEVYGLFKRTEHTIIDRLQIFQDYEKIRTEGVAFDRGEATEGGVCIAVPVFSGPDSVECAMSVSIPLVRYGEELERAVVAALRRSAKELSQHLELLVK
jgi:IclR family acetate operon transcriptional repressor